MALDRKMTRLAKASPEAIAAAAACLRAGGLVAMPTETVYGLAADATSDAAVAAIYAAKERPAINPLIAHVLDIEAAREHAIFGPEAETLARAFWPGPSLWSCPSLRARGSACSRAQASTRVAIRSPSHETARALIEAAGVPLAAPSANRSGAVSPTTAAHVVADLDGRIDWILDGGPCRHGLESTIVACLERPAPVAASRSDHARGDRVRARFAGRRGRARANRAERARANSRRTMRRGPSFGSARPAPPRTKPRSISAASLEGGARERAPRSFALGRPHRGRVPSVLLFARAGRGGRGADRGRADPRHGLGAAINDRLRRAARPAKPSE